jgi:hypothetical protein
MKMYITALIISISTVVYAQQINTTLNYDNLDVSLVSIKNTTQTIVEEKPEIYTLHYSEKNRVFELLMTLYPVTAEDFKIENLKAVLNERGAELISQSEEKEVTIIDIKENSDIKGYYFALTDKNPKQGEYKFLLQGLVKYNHLLGHFTFLCNNRNDIKIYNDINIKSFLKDTPVLKKTIYFEKVKLNEKEIEKYKLQFVKYFYSQQQFTFYNSTDSYSQVLPDLQEKYTQSVCVEKDEGTVFYYYFKDKLGSDQENFLRGLFYGDDGKPSKDHPEIFYVKDNYLIVFSYPYNSRLQNELIEMVKNKLK